MKGRCGSSRQKGYSLLEVVVALAIAATALAALLQAGGSQAHYAALAREYAAATVLAESMLARTGRDIRLEPGTRQGRFDDTFHWRRTVTVYGTDAPLRHGATPPPVTPYEVTVTVSWRTGDRLRDVTLRTLRLNPEAADAAT
jgi:general secretion pathway protein I